MRSRGKAAPLWAISGRSTTRPLEQSGRFVLPRLATTSSCAWSCGKWATRPRRSTDRHSTPTVARADGQAWKSFAPWQCALAATARMRMCNRPFVEHRADTRPKLMQWLGRIGIALLALLIAAPAMAEKSKLRERLTPEVMAVVFPGAERLGPEEGTPPAIAVFKGDKVAAYVFSTLDIVAATGYSTTPFDVIAGVDLDGRITGAKVVFHNENYIVHDRVRQRLLDTFLARETGRPVRGTPANALPPDFVAGATISARAMRAAVLATAALVLRPRVAGTAVTVPTVDVESYTAK